MQRFHSTELCSMAYHMASCVQTLLPSADGRKVDLMHLETESMALGSPVCSDWRLTVPNHLPMPDFAFKIMLRC